jgi:cobalt-zinc-cadmium efflux system outer membrane protein
VAAGLPLPLRNPNQGEIAAARHEELRLRHERAALEGRLRAALDLALRDQRSAAAEIAALEGEIIPQAQAAHDATLAGHARGLFSLTDVLETRRALFELREAGLEAELRHADALARIERLTGAGGRALDELSEESK